MVSNLFFFFNVGPTLTQFKVHSYLDERLGHLIKVVMEPTRDFQFLGGPQPINSYTSIFGLLLVRIPLAHAGNLLRNFIIQALDSEIRK